MIKNYFTKIKNIFFKKEIIFPLSTDIIISTKFLIGKFRNIQVDENAYLLIKDGVIIREFFNLLVFKDARLTIGENVFFNNYCSVNCLGNISIGDNTLLGEGVKIYDHNHKYVFDKGLKVEREQFNISEVSIGKNCWIGSSVTILKGVSIGDNVIIGANCLIYKSIPENSIIKERADLIFDQFEQAQ